MKTLFLMRASGDVDIASGRDLSGRHSGFSRGVFLRRFSPWILGGILLWAAAYGNSALGATPASSPAASAAGINGSDAEVNGARMASGATLFPGDVVRIGADSSAALMFGKSLVLVSPLTEFVVEASGLSLRGGRLQVRASGGESLAVTAPFFKVNTVSSGSAPGLAKMGSAETSSAEIRLSGKHAQVSAVSGSAELTAAGNVAPYNLHAGETASLDAAGADAVPGQGAASPVAGPAAGQLSRVLPQVQIDRASQQIMAAVSAPIYWNDNLHSGSTGRARIALQDGSLLNLGSNSELRVLQHDAQAQQTSLDLAVGRMRGQVMKLTRSGAKFEIKTPVGVAGLVGTDFSLLVTPEYTELMVFEGAVRFTVASTGQAITVPAGMKLRISRTGVTEGPSPATPGEIQTAKKLTDVSENPVQNAGGKGASPLIPVVVSVTAGAVVLAISIPLDLRQPVSPMAVSSTTTPTKPVVD